MLIPNRSHSAKELKYSLRDLPSSWQYQYSREARQNLLQILFRSLVGNNEQLLSHLFCGTVPGEGQDWILRDAQGAVDGAEYTEAARGKPCGHILKGGEATYRCKTCTSDDTCVLCSRCFEASDHQGHMVSVSISPGNSGCCDCGDAEAWNRPVHCAIHSLLPSEHATGKQPEPRKLPDNLTDSIRGTVSAILDYMCDVISCAPEELRQPKTVDSIRSDEAQSRLLPSVYGQSDEDPSANPQYALVLWNDEKHGFLEVQQQVARACKQSKGFGLDKATETDDVGRSVIMISEDLEGLLHKAKIIEQIKITVTIRSARDTFREQMCSTMIEFLLDIAGCSVGQDHDILRQTICEEMLQPWQPGSSASNARIGRDGIYDHEYEESEEERRLLGQRHSFGDITINPRGGITITVMPNAQNADGEEDDDDDEENAGQANTQDAMDVDNEPVWPSETDLEMRADGEFQDESLEREEATMAGYPPPPPPPLPDVHGAGGRGFAGNDLKIPRTPVSHARRKSGRTPLYWLERNFTPEEEPPLAEDIRQRLRLDWMILYDLRLWKKARIDLRDLYISTVVSIPEFKRILGLRFAGLYTLLAQLYLIADREPDHSIIYLSLQMLTTPSITKEVVDKCNFLTSLIAILYTFLTTRQVGSAHDVSTLATLAFDAGSVTNRRMYHFFMDLKHLFANQYVQEQLRDCENYTAQFLDLIKLPQGICPNTRAVGEHIEYETDAWISASILTREVNKLCRQFADAFKLATARDRSKIAETIRRICLATLVNCLGLEKERFRQAEIKHLVRFHQLPNSVLGDAGDGFSKPIVRFVVEEEPISFHHPMHYTLSWLIDGAKSISANDLRNLLSFRAQDLVSALPSVPSWAATALQWDAEVFLLVLFDYPLRVCAWLAQMKAGMWVRNGLSLRHQMSQYRGVTQRNLAHQHDIFLLQTALVVCDPSRILLSMVDRFSLKTFMRGQYVTATGEEDQQGSSESKSPYDETQLLDIVEDFIHLLVIILSERTTLQPLDTDESQQAISIRRDLTHVLCFKPLSYSDLCTRLIDKFQDLDEFQDILNEMTNFKAPEGVSDVGTFELKKEFLADIDPYIAHYTKNQRDEAEVAYRKWMSEKTGRSLRDTVFEPRLRKIHSGVFTGLSDFVGEEAFSYIIFHCLQYANNSQQCAPNTPVTRIESFVQIVLHLVLVSINEDPHHEDGMSDDSEKSFVSRILIRSSSAAPGIIDLLYSLLVRKDFESCHAKIKLIMLRAQQKRPKAFQEASEARGMVLDQLDSDQRSDPAKDIAAKKKAAALARANKVMASFKQQQQDFLTNQTLDWGIDDDDDTVLSENEGVQMWEYPSGNCIYCQEECGDSRLYGTFALIQESNILRHTDVTDSDHVQEVMDLPASLDRSAESIRPYGLASKNLDIVKKFNSQGEEINIERQTLGKGWKPGNCHVGPVSRSCGHIMHYSCFELYYSATIRRHNHQIARHHPERHQQQEFVCPLCKALGNTFVPVLRKGAEKRPVSALEPEISFEHWLTETIKTVVSKHGKLPEASRESGDQVRTPGTSIDWAPETLATTPLFSSETTPSVAQMTPNTSTAQMTPTTSRASSMSPLVSGIANIPGNFPDEAFESPPPMALSMQFCEQPVVKNVCIRLKDTIRKNDLASFFKYPSVKELQDQLCHTDALGHTIGYTITAAEIAQRGVASEAGGLFVDQLSSVALTHLRLLQDFFEVYIATGRIQNKSGRAEEEMHQMASYQLHQLFGGHPVVADLHSRAENVTPALATDPFILLASTTSFFGHVFDSNYQHMVRLCYLLELVKGVHAIWRNIIDGREPNLPDQQNPTSEEAAHAIAFKQFLLFCGLPQIANHQLLGSLSFALYAVKRLQPYATTFLRKVALWLHVVREVDFSGTTFADPDESELNRLSRVLRLPTFLEMLQGAGTMSSGNMDDEALNTLHKIAFSWVTHFYETYGENGHSSLKPFGQIALQPAHPAIFELVGLPKYYDTLLDEMMRRKCPTKPKRDLTDPALCLFCGDIFCGQAVCCMRGNKGGCNTHMQKCGMNVGLFLMLRKCTVLYLAGESGSFVNAPYLDRHGEVDQGLRRSRQLLLNQRRYDALMRTVWLNHMVPTTVARKLEADINNGGWETL